MNSTSRVASYLLLALFGVIIGALLVGAVYLVLHGFHYHGAVCGTGALVHAGLGYLMYLDLRSRT